MANWKDYKSKLEKFYNDAVRVSGVHKFPCGKTAKIVVESKINGKTGSIEAYTEGLGKIKIGRETWGNGQATRNSSGDAKLYLWSSILRYFDTAKNYIEQSDFKY